MKVGDILLSAVRGVTANKLRSILTMLGVLIGVGAVILLMAVGNGSAQRVNSLITSLGTNTLTIRPSGNGTGSSAITLAVSDKLYFAFYSRKSNVRVAYDKINLLEYGQTVGRRLDLAIVISPAFLLVKKRKHFLTVGYADEDGKQQALVFRVDKNDIRATLASLEARTGQKVQYQDEEARKAGRG